MKNNFVKYDVPDRGDRTLLASMTLTFLIHSDKPIWKVVLYFKKGAFNSNLLARISKGLTFSDGTRVTRASYNGRSITLCLKQEDPSVVIEHVLRQTFYAKLFFEVVAETNALKFFKDRADEMKALAPAKTEAPVRPEDRAVSENKGNLDTPPRRIVLTIHHT